MIQTDVINPTKGRVQKWKVGTFDIETVGINGESALLGNMVLGATYDGNKVCFHACMLDLLKYILKTADKIRWFCHNGGGFDFKYILGDKRCLDYLSVSGYTVEIVGGSIAKALMLRRGKKVSLICDSFKLLNQKLDTLAKGFNVETLKGFIDFEGGEVFDKHNPTHIKYLENDVKSLYEVITKYRHIINTEFKTDIKVTASSTAFNCFTSIITDKIFRHGAEVDAFARQAYYGGRTECFYQGEQEGVNYIDVNSLYAYIMYTTGGLHRPFYTTEYAGSGFYRIRACVPLGAKFGLLPFRKLDRTGVIFPVGSFETYATDIEIDLAREHGAEIDVIEGYAFEEHDKGLFKDFIGRCMKMRQTDYQGAKGQAAKFLQNNLYGFFGMNPIREELIISDSPPIPEEGEPEYDMYIDETTGKMVENVWVREVERDTINQVPAFAAYITSAARAYLLRAMLKEESAGNIVLYCDTDSIILKGEPVSLLSDTEYGAFKIEYSGGNFMGITAKTYLLKGRELRTSKDYLTMRCKGLPKKTMKERFYTDALAGVGNPVEFTQLYSLARVVKGVHRHYSKGNKYGLKSVRTMPTIHSITSRTPGPDGFTNPLKLSL